MRLVLNDLISAVIGLPSVEPVCLGRVMTV